MYHICRYFILCTLISASKNLNCFFVSIFLSFFDVRAAILFIFYSSIRPAQLQLQETSDTKPLYVCVCVCVCV